MSTLDRGARIAVFGTYGLLAIIAVLIVLHRKFEQTPTVSSVGLILPRGTLAVSTPFFLIALVLILTGIMFSNATLRYTLVALAAIFLLPAGRLARKGLICCDAQQLIQSRPSLLTLTLLFESMAVVLLLIALLSRKLRTGQIAMLCLLATLIPAGAAGLVSAKWQPGFAPGLMLMTFLVFGPLVLSALVLAGFDLMEWALLLGSIFADAVNPRTWVAEAALWVAISANAVFACRLGLDWDWKNAVLNAAQTGIFIVIFATLIAYFAATPEVRHPHLRHLKLLGLAALTVFAIYFVWMRVVDAPAPVFNYHGIREFSIRYPEGWTPKLEDDGPDFVSLFVHSKEEKGSLVVVGERRTPSGEEYLNKIIPSGDVEFPQTKIKYEAAPDGEWQKFETTLRNTHINRDIHFVVWHRAFLSNEWFLDSDWYVVGILAPNAPEPLQQKLKDSKQSFALSVITVPAASNRKLEFAVWGSIALAALSWMLLGRRSRKPALALLFAVAGMAIALNVRGDFSLNGELIAHGATFCSAQLAFTCASAFVFVWLRKRAPNRDKAVGLIFGFNVAFLAALVFLITYAYGSLFGERSNAVKAIVILLALSWEITTSGELTDHATRSIPRNSRVALFLGYAVLVASGVLCFFPMTYRITTKMEGFDSEQWVIRGILAIGVPFLISTFASRTAALLSEVNQTATAAEQTTSPVGST